MSPVAYTHEYYQRERKLEAKLAAAQVIVPLVLDLLHPQSVIDVGCGTGVWLSVFQEHGLTDLTGADGDWARESLRIPVQRFVSRDLSQPLSLDRTFDLAVSIEVAEHLPPTSADVFIASLVSVAPCVLFSAAIPAQGGTNHVNEQWQDYWAQRFAAAGYAPIDWIRRRTWQDERVAPHLRQNMLLYVRRDVVERHARLKAEAERTADAPLALVHPAQYLVYAKEVEMFRRMRLTELLSVAPGRLWKQATRRWQHR